MEIITPAKRKELVIGLFGFGVVGQGVFEVLTKTSSFNARIKKICIKDPLKKRRFSETEFTTDANLLIEDKEINVIVEAIDDPEAALHILRRSLEKGKSVVTANKMLVASHLEEIISLQKEFGLPVLYEGACCASIPVIRNLEEYYDNDLLRSIRGIVNGSTNYILSKIFNEGIDYNHALLEAKQNGFAESDPSLDVLGTDAANKLSLLLTHGFGNIVDPGNFIVEGIKRITANDIKHARTQRQKIKLVATIRKTDENKITALVLPQFLNEGDDLYSVDDEFNGLVIESSFADKHFLKGKGAGSYPTAAAILSDLSALRYDYKYEYKKWRSNEYYEFTNDCQLRIHVSSLSVEHLPSDRFIEIEEQHCGPGHSWITGIINASQLAGHDWWKHEELSVIGCCDLFADDIKDKRIRRLSLRLAGV